jgi:hypothetical protein
LGKPRIRLGANRVAPKGSQSSADKPYEPTPEAACHETVEPVEFPADTFDDIPAFLDGVEQRHVLVLRQRTYRGKVEDFNLTQLLYLGEEQHEIARIDCCGGTIHLHLHSRDQGVLVDHGLIEKIPPRPAGVRVVDTASTQMWDRMIDNWCEHLRRWDRGR